MNISEFLADGGTFTLQDGILEFWAGGASWGRYRVADIAPLYIEEKNGKLRVGVSPGPASVVVVGSRGVQVEFSDRAEFDAFVSAIGELRTPGS